MDTQRLNLHAYREILAILWLFYITYTITNALPHADIGDYAELTIQFSGIPKTQYNDSSWQSRLLNGVQLAITEIHTDLLSELIELVGVRVVTQNNSEIITKDSNILKRQAGANTVVFVYVDVNILPAEYTSQSIGDSFQVTTHECMYVFMGISSFKICLSLFSLIE